MRVIFEGDEEHISEPVTEFIDAHPELLTADVCIVSDSDMQDDEGTPAITYGLRGIAYWEVRVQGPFQDVHSGSYGGGVDNPANVLVKMLASLVDEDGRVTVPGFYDDVVDLTDAEREAYATVPFDHDGFMKATGVTEPMSGERGWTLVERLSGTADVRHQRHLGRLPGRGIEDDHPRLRGGQAEHATGARTRIRGRSRRR